MPPLALNFTLASRGRTSSSGSSCSSRTATCSSSACSRSTTSTSSKLVNHDSHDTDSEVSSESFSSSSSSSHRVSFNPEILVMETLPPSVYQHKTQTWYSDAEIASFQHQVYKTVRRFQNKKLTREDCLRGLECQTTRCSASSLRVALAKDLILKQQKEENNNKQQQHSKAKISQMMKVVTGASIEEAMEIAQQDARETRMYQDEDSESILPCFFLLDWLLPSSSNSTNQMLV